MKIAPTSLPQAAQQVTTQQIPEADESTGIPTFDIEPFEFDYKPLSDNLPRQNVLKQRVTAILNKDPQIWDERLGSEKASEGGHVSNWLGWINAPDTAQNTKIPKIKAFVEDVQDQFDEVVVFGTGGSGLGNALLMTHFGTKKGRTLDLVDPIELRKQLSTMDLKRTLFIVASKSGTNGEIDILEDYFRRQVNEAGGNAEKQFIAITDSGTPKDNQSNFPLGIFLNDKDVGGRESFLTYFGLLPAALAGVNIDSIAAYGRKAQDEYFLVKANQVSVTYPIGVLIGDALAQAHAQGRDKITMVFPPSIEHDIHRLGPWTGQEINESLGKGDNAVMLISGEPASTIGQYGNDRIFLKVEFGESGFEVLTQRGESNEEIVPVIKVTIPNKDCLPHLMYHLQWARTLLALDMGVHPLNQPDVEKYKKTLKAALREVASGKSVEEIASDVTNQGAKIHNFSNTNCNLGDVAIYSTKALGDITSSDSMGTIAKFFKQIKEGQAIGFLPATYESDAMTTVMSQIREFARDVLPTAPATLGGFISRIMHSDSQLYLAEADKTTAVIFTFDTPPEKDIELSREAIKTLTGVEPAEGTTITYGDVNKIIASGFFQSLNNNGKKAIRIHLGAKCRQDPLDVETLICDSILLAELELGHHELKY